MELWCQIRKQQLRMASGGDVAWTRAGRSVISCSARISGTDTVATNDGVNKTLAKGDGVSPAICGSFWQWVWQSADVAPPLATMLASQSLDIMSDGVATVVA